MKFYDKLKDLNKFTYNHARAIYLWWVIVMGLLMAAGFGRCLWLLPGDFNSGIYPAMYQRDNLDEEQSIKRDSALDKRIKYVYEGLLAMEKRVDLLSGIAEQEAKNQEGKE